MNTQLWSWLATAPAADLEALADRILAVPGTTVAVVEGPEVLSVPLRWPGDGDEPSVVIGHTTITTCRIHLDGVRGDGVRPGRDLAGAVAAAVCVAEADRDGTHAGAVDELAAKGREVRDSRALERAALVAATRMESS